MIRTRKRLWVMLMPLLFIASPYTQAAKYDLHLDRYITSCNNDITCANTLFTSMMRELGVITAPVFLSPAETLGLNGFSFALEGTIAPINSGEDYWTVAAEGKDLSSVLFIPHLHVRKGLPFSVELGTQLSYIPDSEYFLVGAEAKWALNEGFYFIPDFAVRLSINHMIGAKDFDLTTGGWDISVSKAIGIGGMLSLTPYAGYNMMFVHATSHVVLYPSDPNDVTGEWIQEVFNEVNWQDNMFHRFFVGCRLKSYIFQFTVEGIFATNEISMFSFKLGFDY